MHVPLALNTAQAALTNPWTQTVTFDATQCTFIADGGCGRTVEVCLVKP